MDDDDFDQIVHACANPSTRLEGTGNLLPRVVARFFDRGQYVRQSDEYSKALCTAFHLDLITACPVYADHIRRRQTVHAINSGISDLKNGNEWDDHAWDFVAGPAGVTESRNLKYLTPYERLKKQGIEISLADLEHFLYVAEVPAIAQARIALEAKALKDRLGGSVPNRFKEIALLRRWANEFDRRCLAVAIVVCDASDDEVQQARDKLLRLQVRSHSDGEGLDALIIIPVLGQMVLPNHVQYDSALRHLAGAYEVRFGVRS